MAESDSDYSEISEWRPSKKYFHANAASHSWAFSAFAELIDNAYDAKARECHIDVYLGGGAAPHMVSISDNGCGMSMDELDKMLNLGFCDKDEEGSRTHKPLGRFGNGFKSGSMFLAKDALVITHKRDSDEFCVGMLSQTFQDRRSEDIVLIPKFTMTHGERWQVRGKADQKNCVAIQTVFPQKHIMREAIKLKESKEGGTHILLKNLNCNFYLEDAHDICIHRKSHDAPARQDRKIDYLHSLKAYCSILFLKSPMSIIIRGQKVKLLNIKESLDKCKTYSYTPKIKRRELETHPRRTQITFGVNEIPEISGEYGVLMYWRNRLIRPFEKECLGFHKEERHNYVGVVDMEGILTPLHNKQDFDRNLNFTRARKNFKEKVAAYCDFVNPAPAASTSRAENVEDFDDWYDDYGLSSDDDLPDDVEEPEDNDPLLPNQQIHFDQNQIPAAVPRDPPVTPPPSAGRDPPVTPPPSAGYFEEEQEQDPPGPQIAVPLDGPSPRKRPRTEKSFQSNVFKLLDYFAMYFEPREPVDVPFFDVGTEGDIEKTVTKLVEELGLVTENCSVFEKYDIPAPPVWPDKKNLTSWDNSITEIFIDTEGRIDELKQIAAVRMANPKEFNVINIQQNGQNSGLFPSIQNALRKFCEFLSETPNNVLIGHSINTRDRPALMRALMSCGLMEDFTRHVKGFMDTTMLFRAKYRGLPSHNLESLVAHFLGQTYVNHTAQGDVKVLQQLLRRVSVTKKEKEEASSSLEYAVALFNRSENLRKNYPSLEPLVEDHVIPDSIAKKMAESGLNLENLERVYRKGRQNGIKEVLSKTRVICNGFHSGSIARFLEQRIFAGNV